MTYKPTNYPKSKKKPRYNISDLPSKIRCTHCHKLKPQADYTTYRLTHGQFICKLCYNKARPTKPKASKLITLEPIPFISTDNPELDEIKKLRQAINSTYINDYDTSKPYLKCSLCHVVLKNDRNNFPGGATCPTVCRECINILGSTFMTSPQTYPESYLIYKYNPSSETLAYAPVFPPHQFPYITIVNPHTLLPQQYRNQPTPDDIAAHLHYPIEYLIIKQEGNIYKVAYRKYLPIKRFDLP